jgi:hypothetical protein
MVSLLLAAILQVIAKHRRRMLDGVEDVLPPPFFPPVRKKILRELGKDELERDIQEIIKQHVERHGKGK